LTLLTHHTRPITHHTQPDGTELPHGPAVGLAYGRAGLRGMCKGLTRFFVPAAPALWFQLHDPADVFNWLGPRVRACERTLGRGEKPLDTA
jgi:hypothetical protein